MYDKQLKSPYLLAFMVDMCEDKLEAGVDKETTLSKATEVSSKNSLIISFNYRAKFFKDFSGCSSDNQIKIYWLLEQQIWLSEEM